MISNEILVNIPIAIFLFRLCQFLGNNQYESSLQSCELKGVIQNEGKEVRKSFVDELIFVEGDTFFYGLS